ncbi:MAG: hypothetical protein WD646_12875 [Actinomycetota bacterium]
MAGYSQLAKDVGDQVESVVKPLQDLSVDVVTSVAKTVGDILPEVKVAVPTPEEVVDANFSLVEQLLGSQKSYVKSLLSALEPITSKLVGSSKPARKVTAA